MSKLSIKEQLLCINAISLQTTLCYHTGQQLAHCGGREGKKQKYLYLTKHVHYFMKSLSHGSCETMTKFQSVYNLGNDVCTSFSKYAQATSY